MKKYLTILLSLTLVLALFGCSSTDSQQTTTSSEPSPTETGETVDLKGKKVMLALNALGDLSFNDLLYEGLKTIEEKYEMNVEFAEVGTDISTYEGYFFDFVDQNYDYIFLRPGFLDLCKEYAADYPDTKFIIYDMTPLDTIDADNVYLYSVGTYQAAYLVGMAAAGTSKTGTIGFVGGQENPLINDFLCGYIQGAVAYNPDIKVCSAFVGNYNDTAKALELATAQISSNNADIIFAACGGASLGVFEACKNNDILAIGCDSDQYSVYNQKGETELAQVIMTSCLKKIDQSIVAIMDKVASGEDIFTLKQAESLDLKDGAVGVADNDNYQKLVSEEVRTAIKNAQEEIINGDITVQSAYYMSQSEIDSLINSVTP